MSAQHTPGPWNLESGWRITSEVFPKGGHIIARVENCFIANKNHFSPETTKANARLIAAAPDLLRDLNDAVCEIELCRAVLKDYARGLKTDPDAAVRRIKVAGDVAENARAAIAKATRET